MVTWATTMRTRAGATGRMGLQEAAAGAEEEEGTRSSSSSREVEAARVSRGLAEMTMVSGGEEGWAGSDEVPAYHDRPFSLCLLSSAQ